MPVVVLAAMVAALKLRAGDKVRNCLRSIKNDMVDNFEAKSGSKLVKTLIQLD